jgi:hypothetical protein
MKALTRTLITGLLCVSALIQAADVPRQQRPEAITLPEIGQSFYYWRTISVGNTAQLLTLFCRACRTAAEGTQDLPLVSVLRDTLGDNDSENDRVTYVWLLSYSRLNFGQRILSAVPFFYWRVGDGSKSVGPRDTPPLFDLTAPQHPVMSAMGRNILQWAALDPMIFPVRASSRAYHANQLDHERLHLEGAISYLRQAPASNDSSALTQSQLDTIIARLELRKRLLGGLATEARAERFGTEAGFEQERIRSRNWELLRQCAEKTGLLFEPISLASASDQYVMLWFPLKGSFAQGGTSLRPIWKLLNIRNPWSDERLKAWKGSVYTRAVDENGSLVAADAPGAREVDLIPLGFYSLTYPKVPLLLLDFRDKLHVRRHEMTQRSINEIAAGIIGLSHFTNWYYYVGLDLYQFVAGRRGGAVDQAERLDSYSQLRSVLALDRQLDAELRREMQRRLDSLAVNPMEATPSSELQSAEARYTHLAAEAADGRLIARIEKQRRSELAYFSDTRKTRLAQGFLHEASLGLYTRRAKENSANLSTLDRNRRINYHLRFLDSLAAANTQPEVAYDSSRIQSSVAELSALMPTVSASQVRVHAATTLDRLKTLSQDQILRMEFSTALVSLKINAGSVRTAAPGIISSPRTISVAPTDGVTSFK